MVEQYRSVAQVLVLRKGSLASDTLRRVDAATERVAECANDTGHVGAGHDHGDKRNCHDAGQQVEE
jgi:hypothetical protein